MTASAASSSSSMPRSPGLPPLFLPHRRRRSWRGWGRYPGGRRGGECVRTDPTWSQSGAPCPSLPCLGASDVEQNLRISELGEFESREDLDKSVMGPPHSSDVAFKITWTTFRLAGAFKISWSLQDQLDIKYCHSFENGVTLLIMCHSSDLSLF